jgi:MFS family permease
LSGQSARRAIWALPLLFILLGTVFASWASRIPAIRDVLHLSAGELGFALLCAGVGGLASFPLAAWMVARHGHVTASLCGGTMLLIALPCLAFAPSLGALMLALGLLGASASCFDVAINALGAAAEKLAGRSIMSMLHAWFCVGTVSGALLGSAMASLAVNPRTHFAILSGLMLPLLWLACERLRLAAGVTTPAAGDEAGGGGARGTAAPTRRRYGLPPAPLLILGLIGFCGAIAEGGIADWSGVFMQDRIGASAGMAPLSYAGFSVAMLIARVFADRLKDRFGAPRVIACGGWVAAIGMGIVIAENGTVTSIAGFALAGAGLAGVFPFVFSAAGRHGPTALAGVATMSYCGALVGPPLIGFIAQGAGLTTALGCIGLLSAFMAITARRTASLR